MLKDKIELVIETLFTATESGNLIWYEDNSHYDKRYKRIMKSSGEDSSLYELEIEYKINNDSFVLDKEPSLWIQNLKLPNGRFCIYGGRYNLTKIRDIIMIKFLPGFKPTLGDLEDTLDEISKGISVSEFRNGKINKILN